MLESERGLLSVLLAYARCGSMCHPGGAQRTFHVQRLSRLVSRSRLFQFARVCQLDVPATRAAGAVFWSRFDRVENTFDDIQVGGCDLLHG